MRTNMLSQNLRVLMAYKGASSGDLAKAVGVTAPTVANWRLGKTTPNVTQLNSVAEFLEVSVDYLLKNLDISPIT